MKTESGIRFLRLIAVKVYSHVSIKGTVQHKAVAVNKKQNVMDILAKFTINLVHDIILMYYVYACDQLIAHSRPRSPRSFWSVPEIKTSGRSKFVSMHRVLFQDFQPIRFVRFDNEPVTRRLPVFRGRTLFLQTIFQYFSRTFQGLRLIFTGLQNSHQPFYSQDLNISSSYCLYISYNISSENSFVT